MVKALSFWHCGLGCRAVIKTRGPGISPGYYECLPRLLSQENKRKIEPKEVPSCLIPHLLVVFTQQLEILVTTLRMPYMYMGWVYYWSSSFSCSICYLKFWFTQVVVLPNLLKNQNILTICPNM